jgi:hypothetical protein
MTPFSMRYALHIRKSILVGLGVLVLLTATYAGVHAYLEHRTRLEMDRFIAANARQARITYDRLSLTWFGFKPRLTQLAITPAGQNQPWRVDAVNVNSVDLFNQPPYYADLTLSGFELGSDVFSPEVNQYLNLLNTDHLRGNADLNYRFDPDNLIFELKQGRIDLKGGGLMTLSATLSNARFQLLRDPGAMIIFLIALTQTRLESARLEFQDRGLVERYIEQAAAITTIDPEQYRQAMLNGLDQEIMNAPDESTRQVLTEIRLFLAAPGRIVFTVDPTTTIKLESLMSIRSLLDLVRVMNLKAATDPLETVGP